MPVGELATLSCPSCERVFVCMDLCGWLSAYPGSIPSFVHCSWDRLQIHCNADRSYWRWMNEYVHLISNCGVTLEYQQQVAVMQGMNVCVCVNWIHVMNFWCFPDSALEKVFYSCTVWFGRLGLFLKNGFYCHPWTPDVKESLTCL